MTSRNGPIHERPASGVGGVSGTTKVRPRGGIVKASKDTRQGSCQSPEGYNGLPMPLPSGHGVRVSPDRQPMTITQPLAAVLIACLAADPAVGQSYYNLDAGRAMRVEDAVPTPRYELELMLPNVRYERLGSGTTKWRTEPKLAYGVAPLAEVEVRALLLSAYPADGSPRRKGLAGIAVGVMRALGVEHAPWPVAAIAAEWIAPVGSLAPNIGSYSVKLIATKTTAVARLHANAAYGTYSSPVNVCALPRAINAPPPPGCSVFQIPFDTPCSVAPLPITTLASCGTLLTREEPAPEFDPTRFVGMRWFGAVGADHAFALASTLVSADVVAERFAGLFARTDLSADIAVRRQLTPQVVVDAGLTRHFTGLLRSNAVNLGLTYGIARPFQRRAP